MKKLVRSAFLFAGLAGTFAPLAQAAGPHVHGVGALNLAVDGTGVFIELHSPAADVFGFEHAPRTAGQREQVAAAMVRLADGAALFRAPAEAGCELREAAPVSPFEDESGHGHDHGHHHEEHGHDHGGHEAHADVSATYGFACAAAPAWVEVGLFEAFPGMQRLDVQFITASGQGKAVLERGASRLDLP